MVENRVNGSCHFLCFFFVVSMDHTLSVVRCIFCIKVVTSEHELVHILM